MFYRASAIIASEHAELSEEIEAIDSYLHEMSGQLFRLERASDHLGIKPRQLERLLDLYQEHDIVEHINVFICPECDVILEEDDDCLLCDLCESSYEKAKCNLEIAYRVRPSVPINDTKRIIVPPATAESSQESLPESFLKDPFQNAPLLSYYSLKIKTQPLQGKRILCLLHFLRDLIPFVEAMKRLGLDPQVSYFYYKEYPYPQRDAVAQWLSEQGCRVRCITDLGDDLSMLEQEDATRIGEILILEDGGLIYPRILGNSPHLLEHTRGCVEQTTRGIRNIQKLLNELNSAPNVPVLSVAGSKLKAEFEPPHVADAVVRNIRSLLGDIDLRGKTVALLGYGTIGEKLAERLHNEGMRVTVYDPDDSKLLKASQAQTISHTSETAREAVREKFLVLGSSGECAIGKGEILDLKHRTHLASASSEQYEFAITELYGLSGGRMEPFSPQGTTAGTVYKLRKDDVEIVLLANGYPVNFWGLNSMPDQASDLVLTLLLLSIAEIASGRVNQAGIDAERVNKLAEDNEVAKLYRQHHAI